MAQPVLHTDDTPIRTLAPGAGKTRLSRFWVYAVDPRPYAGPGPPAAFYRYSPDRKGERPREHRAGFSGVLHADAFTGYDALYRPEPGKPARIRHAACWAHARRKLFEVHEATKSPIAEEALHRIQALYQIEADITGQPATQRQAERQVRSKPLLVALKTWMDVQRRRASGKTALGTALHYALGRWEALTRYADDGRLAIDNNLAERLLHSIAVTRKNFLFLGSNTSGERAAILYTLSESAKLNGQSRSLLGLRHRPARLRPTGLQAQRTAALELQGRHPRNLSSLNDVNRGDQLTLTLNLKLETLRAAVAAEPRDIARINLALRSLLLKVVVDWENARLVLRWRHGGSRPWTSTASAKGVDRGTLCRTNWDWD